MKYFKTLAILLLSSVISFYACNDNTKTSKQETLKPTEVTALPTPSSPAAPKPATSEPAQNTGGVWHYTCLKGCAGGAGSAINCNTCGSPLAHNSAYHAKANNAPTAPYAIPPASNVGKNAAGIWHYTCDKGCTGGSGSAGTCATCGSTLAHNAAYHQ